MANEIRVRGNNISGAINDNPLLIGATTINSPAFADLPTIGATNHLLLVLDPLEVAGAAEIVRVTAHGAASTSVTVVRGAEGSVARQHALGTTWFHGPVAGDWILTDTTSGTRPAVPYSGQIIFETDTDKFVARNSAGTTWYDIMDLGVWDTWSPELWQGNTVTSTTQYASFVRMGRLIILRCAITATGAGTGGNEIQIRNIPTAIQGITTRAMIGSFRYFDSGTTIYAGTALGVSSTRMNFFVSGNGNPMGLNPTFTVANGDFMEAGIIYEALA